MGGSRIGGQEVTERLRKHYVENASFHIHNIIQIPKVFCGPHNIPQNTLHIQSECEEFSMKYCRSHRTLLWM